MSNPPFVYHDPQEVLEENWDEAYEITRALAAAEAQPENRLEAAIRVAARELLRDHPGGFSTADVYAVARRILEEHGDSAK